MSEIWADDTKYSLNLKKMTKRAKKDKVIFSNIAKFLIEGEVGINDDSWPKKQDIISITALILSSINIVAIIWIIYKVRILCMCVTAIKENTSYKRFTITIYDATYNHISLMDYRSL